MALLDVRDLRVTFQTQDGDLEAVRGVSFAVAPGQMVGIVGESGSGKTVASQAIVGLTRARGSPARCVRGPDLLVWAADGAPVRGAQIAMVFQDPLSSLHPLYGRAPDRRDDSGPPAR